MELKTITIAVCVLFVFTITDASNEKLAEIFSWKEIDYAYPNENARKAAIDSGAFVKENNLPLGLEVYKDKLFITLPRWKSGIPATLNYVSLKDLSNKSPNLIPYPNFEVNDISKDTNDTKIVSVFRVRADECDRLWIMDTGVANILGDSKRFSSPKLIVYDLKTDSIIREYDLKDDHQKENSFFANVVVDVTPKTCDKAYAYLPDLGSNAIIVYSWEKNDSWRVKHHYFHLDPLAGSYKVAGVDFHWDDGVFGLALSPVLNDGYRTVYFHALSSNREFTVSSKVLQNETIAVDPSLNYYEFKSLGSRGPDSQATASFLDEPSGVIFYTQVNKNGIGCWNSIKNANEYSADTNGLVTSDNETMIFPNDLKVDRDSNLWVLTDRLPIYIYKKIDPQETNYRIFKAPVAEAIKGTVCDTDKGGKSA